MPSTKPSAGIGDAGMTNLFFTPIQLFQLGAVVSTPAVMELLDAETMVTLLRRHATGDWGDLDADDARSNDAAVNRGSGRLLSVYEHAGHEVWIITEADRSVTTFLLPEEY